MGRNWNEILINQLMKKLICLILGHDWFFVDGYLPGQLNGRICQRCNLEEGDK